MWTWICNPQLMRKRYHGDARRCYGAGEVAETVVVVMREGPRLLPQRWASGYCRNAPPMGESLRVRTSSLKRPVNRGYGFGGNSSFSWEISGACYFLTFFRACGGSWSSPPQSTPGRSFGISVRGLAGCRDVRQRRASS